MIFVALTQLSCVVPSQTEIGATGGGRVKGCGTLDKMPFQEAWYGMYFKEDKVGYSHFKIQPDGKNFNVISDSVMRLTALKKTNEITMKEKVTVKPDLTLISFESNVHMNGKDLHMVGKAEGKKFVVDMEVEGEKLTREYPLEERIFHSSAISLMPALRGLRDGDKYSFGVFNAERQGLEKIEQEVATVRGDPGPNGAIWKVKNQYGKSTVVSWLDKRGLTVLEKGLDGALLTVLEDETAARRFLEKKTSGKDLIMDVSLIKIAKPIPNPGKLRHLRLKIKGIAPSFIAEDHRQRVTALGKTGQEGFEVNVQVEDIPRQKKGSESFSDDDLAATEVIQSGHAEITAQAAKIVSPSDSPEQKVKKLVKWTAENIKSQMKDSFTALSVLRSKEGECQSHASLYTAMARSQKVPTRIVMGLVYSENLGFLYHAWAESFVDGWISVDPTFNQTPSDATHVKIASSDDSEQKTAILKMVGKVNLEVLEYK